MTIAFGSGCTPGACWYLWNLDGTYSDPNTTYAESGSFDYVSATDPSQYGSSGYYADDWYVFNSYPGGGSVCTHTLHYDDGWTVAA